jgi:hypothetical protein
MAVWRNLIYIISEQGGIQLIFIECYFDTYEGYLNEVSPHWVLSYCSTWTGMEALIIVFLKLFLIMVTLTPLSGCIIYLTDQQEDRDISVLYPTLL